MSVFCLSFHLYSSSPAPPVLSRPVFFFFSVRPYLCVVCEQNDGR